MAEKNDSLLSVSKASELPFQYGFSKMDPVLRNMQMYYDNFQTTTLH